MSNPYEIKNLAEVFTLTAARRRAAENQIFYYKRAARDERTPRTIWEAYGKPSTHKVRAFDYCRSLCFKLNGTGLVILGHNSQTFSVGFTFPNPETGEIMFAFITRDYNSVFTYPVDYLPE